MLWNVIFGTLALLSLGLVLWQWLVARRFPLHQSAAPPSSAPPVTLLKSLKGCDDATEGCLRSWFEQDYPGQVQVLFGVASPEDAVCPMVRRLIAEFPSKDAWLVVVPGPLGPNAKMSKLAALHRLARHELIVISDADVWAPPGVLSSVTAPLQDPRVGLVHCFYRLANLRTLAMRWEAVAINADFWSQVLQARSLKSVDFAMGAVMATRRGQIEAIGGLAALENCLADDYQLGNRIARGGGRIEFARTVVECRSAPMAWKEVWKHQLRWARTIRVCQPLPYFFSILSNGTLWPLVWLAVQPGGPARFVAPACWVLRMLTALDLQRRLTQERFSPQWGWLVPVKDLLQTLIWLLAFVGNRIEWRGQRFRLRPDGTLVGANGDQPAGAGGSPAIRGAGPR